MELAFHECIATANTTGMIGSTKSTVDLGVAQSGGGAFFDTSPATPGLDELTVTDISFSLGTTRQAVLYRLQTNTAVGIAVEVNQTTGGQSVTLATVSPSTPFLRTFALDGTTYVLVLRK